MAETAAGLSDTRCVYEADREADCVAMMSVTAEKLIGEIRFIFAARRGVKSLSVHQQLLVKRLSIPNGKKGEDKGALEVSCLVAREIDPPRKAATEDVIKTGGKHRVLHGGHLAHKSPDAIGA